jgi:hypothetical protein
MFARANLGLLALVLISARVMAFEIPKGLNESDRLEIIRTLGLNAATKLLDDPYPLGGYSGFELGVSTEFVDIRDIRRLGCQPGTAGCANTSISDDTQWQYSRITIGKGLYHDLDVFFHFMTPSGGASSVTDFGAAVRWSFYQARFLPINVALVGHFDQLNYQDAFTNRNVGADIMVGVDVDNFAIFFGGGELEAAGTFIGPDPATGNCNANCTVAANDPTVDPTSGTVTDHVIATHTVVGVSLHYENLFGAAEVDRYQDAVYSLKVGVRY